MADAFELFLNSGAVASNLTRFSTVAREIDCSRGRPDFLAVKFPNDFQLDFSLRSVGYVGAYILSMLKPISVRTFDYLRSHCTYSESSLKRTLNNLLDLGYVKYSESPSCFVLGEKCCFPQYEIWSFELKLSNTKRAIFQAQQSRIFADRSIIVVPPGRERPFFRYQQSLDRFGIGVAVFDPINLVYEILVPPKNKKASCKQDQIYTLMQIGSAQCCLR